MKIKVCGLKDVENMLAVAGLEPDYVGFIRYAKSPRYDADLSADTLKKISREIIKTGVFVDKHREQVHDELEQFRFSGAQFHGDEDPGFCAEFKDSIEVIKAFGVDENFDFRKLDAYKDSVDFFLFDTKTPIHGGSGKSFDWSLLDKYKLDIPFFLSGGLSLENLEEVKKIKHPAFYGVDLNSRFETEPGMKDIDKLRQAFALLRK